MDILRSLPAPRRAKQLLLGVTAAAALLLLGACGSESPAPSESDTVDEGASAAGSVANDPTDGNTSTDSSEDNSAEETEGSTVSPTERYLTDATALLDAVTASSDSVAAQLEQADVESAAWRTKTASTLRELAAVLESTAALEAPAEYSAQHQQLVDATSKYGWATEMLANGVETLDLDTISDAAALLANASSELATAKAGLVG